jgi:predicted transcriptional regulator
MGITVTSGMLILLGIRIYIWQARQICLELVILFKSIKEIVTRLYNITERQYRSGVAS